MSIVSSNVSSLLYKAYVSHLHNVHASQIFNQRYRLFASQPFVWRHLNCYPHVKKTQVTSRLISSVIDVIAPLINYMKTEKLFTAF